VNPQESPITPVSNLELILRIGKTIQGQASKSDTKGNPLFSSGKSTIEKFEFFSKSIDEKTTVNTIEEQSLFDQQENTNDDKLIDSNLIEKTSTTLEISHSSSSLESFHSQQREDHLNIYTSLLVVEHLLQELSAKGEENLAGQLANFYRASYQTSFPLEYSPLSHSSSVEDSKKKPSPFSPMIVMAAPPPLMKMQQILAARYEPLILPNPVSTMPMGDYQKYMPKVTGEVDVSAEEHIEAFYSYAENLNIEEEDVWTQVFVQSLDGHARKWFKELPAGSIAGIKQLDETFLKHWGDRRDFVYYIT
jgi:hypothetical protein